MMSYPTYYSTELKETGSRPHLRTGCDPFSNHEVTSTSNEDLVVVPSDVLLQKKAVQISIPDKPMDDDAAAAQFTIVPAAAAAADEHLLHDAFPAVDGKKSSGSRAVYVALRGPDDQESVVTFQAFADIPSNNPVFNSGDSCKQIETADFYEEIMGGGGGQPAMKRAVDDEPVYLRDDEARAVAQQQQQSIALPTQPLPLEETLNGIYESKEDFPSPEEEQFAAEKGSVLGPSCFESLALRLPPDEMVVSSSRQRSCSTSSSFSMVSSRSPNSSPTNAVPQTGSSMMMHSAAAPPDLDNSSMFLPDVQHQLLVKEKGDAAAAPVNTTKRAAKRRSKNPIPETNKDERYWRRRVKNNMAAKRSREAKRFKEDQLLEKSAILEERNLALSQELVIAKAEIERLKQRLSKYEEL